MSLLEWFPPYKIPFYQIFTVLFSIQVQANCIISDGFEYMDTSKGKEWEVCFSQMHWVYLSLLKARPKAQYKASVIEEIDMDLYIQDEPWRGQERKVVNSIHSLLDTPCIWSQCQ